VRRLAAKIADLRKVNRQTVEIACDSMELLLRADLTPLHWVRCPAESLSEHNNPGRTPRPGLLLRHTGPRSAALSCRCGSTGLQGLRRRRDQEARPGGALA
jgi:hypothetical protein